VNTKSNDDKERIIKNFNVIFEIDSKNHKEESLYSENIKNVDKIFNTNNFDKIENI
jgi:hypothetical protein